MKVIQFISAFLCFSLLSQFSLGQCSLTVMPSTANVYCGDTLILSAFVNSGVVDFNTGTSPPGWQVNPIGAVTYSNPCGESPDSTTHAWFGDFATQPRDLTSPAFDFSTPSSVCFEMRYSFQGDAAPCEGPDEPQEGVYFQYSIDGGANWVTIHYFDPLGGNDPVLTVWNTYCFQLPAGALTPNTQLRWLQDAISGPEYDHWGLDNISVLQSDTNYTITWYPSGTVGNYDTIAISNSTDSISATARNGTDSCTSVVDLNVQPVSLVLSAGVDSVICPDSCINLIGEAQVIVDNGGDTTYSSMLAISSIFGLPVEGQLGVSGLSSTYIGFNDILEVCVDLTAGANLAEVVLICPDSTELILFSVGTLTSNIANLCFSPTATQAIDNSVSPYSGFYLPASGASLNDLVGCPVNGTWRLRVTSSGSSGFAIVGSWHITLHEPILIRPVDYTWTPATDLDNPLLLNPLACPTDTTMFHLTVNDPTGCVSGTDSVLISVLPECIVSTLELEEGAKAFIPTAFTPNGDGLNDKFYPEGMGLDEYELSIYDRYNNLVFVSNGSNTQWDGRNKKGTLAPQGVYLWTLKIKDKTTGWQEHNGRVTLLR